MLRESEVFVYYFDVRVLLCCRWEFFVVVLLGMNVFLNAELMLMMAQSRAEGTRETYNHGQYLNQFPTNKIKVIREFERIQKKICWHKMSIMFNEICIYDYIDMCLYICIYAEYMLTLTITPRGHTRISLESVILFLLDVSTSICCWRSMQTIFNWLVGWLVGWLVFML